MVPDSRRDARVQIFPIFALVTSIGDAGKGKAKRLQRKEGRKARSMTEPCHGKRAVGQTLLGFEEDGVARRKLSAIAEDEAVDHHHHYNVVVVPLC